MRSIGGSIVVGVLISFVCLLPSTLAQAFFIGATTSRTTPTSSSSSIKMTAGIEQSESSDIIVPPAPVTIAYAGNSMIYFFDTPRFFSNLAGENRVASQDSCLRGGASLPSLLKDGNGMRNKFRVRDSTEADIGAPTVKSLLSSGGEKKWDYLVMNDYTQAPARLESRERTIETLLADYAPLIKECGAIPVFIVTPAYRKPVNNSTDLGSPEQFTERTKHGCEAYASALDRVLPAAQRCRVAPVGLAYLHIRKNNPSMWEKLFHIDDFHPSPHGTYLQGCVLHWTLFGCAPERNRALAAAVGGDDDNDDDDIGRRLWGNARLMQPPSDDESKLPTASEAEYLWNVAGEVCREYHGL